MAMCGNCKAESTRVRSRWNENEQLPDECPNCAPDSFGKFTMPSDRKLWMGYEAHPNEYVKAPDGGYDRKPEYRAEQEAKLSEETEEERQTRLNIEAKKRATRRTEPMNEIELQAAMRKAEEVASFLTASASQGRDVN